MKLDKQKKQREMGKTVRCIKMEGEEKGPGPVGGGGKGDLMRVSKYLYVRMIESWNLWVCEWGG